MSEHFASYYTVDDEQLHVPDWKGMLGKLTADKDVSFQEKETLGSVCVGGILQAIVCLSDQA